MKLNTKKLEKLLNIAENTIKQTEETLKEIDEIIPSNENLPQQQEEQMNENSDITHKEIFSLQQLKKDFELVRRNLISLVEAGQKLIQKIDVLNFTDLKASQIEALSNLQNVIGNNLKLVIDLYKQILELEDKSVTIEQKKQKQLLLENEKEKNPKNISQTNIYIGTLNDVLKELEGNEVIEVKENE